MLANDNDNNTGCTTVADGNTVFEISWQPPLLFPATFTAPNCPVLFSGSWLMLIETWQPTKQFQELYDFANWLIDIIIDVVEYSTWQSHPAITGTIPNPQPLLDWEPPYATKLLIIPTAHLTHLQHVPPTRVVTLPSLTNISQYQPQQPCQTCLSLWHTHLSVLILIAYPISSVRLASPAILLLPSSGLPRTIIGPNSPWPSHHCMPKTQYQPQPCNLPTPFTYIYLC